MFLFLLIFDQNSSAMAGPSVRIKNARTNVRMMTAVIVPIVVIESPIILPKLPAMLEEKL